MEFVEVPTGSAAAQRPAAAGRDAEPRMQLDAGAGRDRGNSDTLPGRPATRSGRPAAEMAETDDEPMISVPTEPRWSLWGDVES